VRVTPLILFAFVATACDSGSKPSGAGSAAAAAKLDIPQVPASPALVALPSSPRVSVKHDAIEVNGKKVMTLAEGVVAAEDKKDGAHGIAITTLGAALAPLAKDAPLVVAFDRKLSYRLLVEVLYTAKQKDAGFKKFLFAVTDGKTELAIPLALPERGPGGVAYVARNDVKTNGRIATEMTKNEDSSLTSDTVLRKIQSLYQQGLKRCFQDALTRNPKLGGNVALSFTVDRQGKVVKPSAKGFDDDIDACMTSKMSTWRFPIPKDKDGEPTEATFTTKLVLVADGGEVDRSKPKAKGPATDEELAEIAEELAKLETPRGSLEKPDATPVQPLLVDPDKMPVQLVVSIAKDELLLWSISGLEGTLKEPRASLPLRDPATMTKLNAQLLDIVKRRWDSKDRLPDTQQILVMADRTTPLQTVAEVFAAVRSSSDGKTVLFPDILLSSGFE
jgi:biopolymer transport protein ExbD